MAMSDVRAQSGLTPAQRAWIEELGVLVGAPPPGEGERSGGGSPLGRTRGAEDREEIVPQPDVGGEKARAQKVSAGGVVGALLGSTRGKVTIKNRSDKSLDLVSADVETKLVAKFEKAPDATIDAQNGDCTIVVSVPNIPLPPPVFSGPSGGVGGHVLYEVNDAQNTRVFMQWESGIVPDPAVVKKITPAESEKLYTLEGDHAGDRDFFFTFKSKGGPPPPPPPPPGPSTAVQVSCLITVTNSTKSALTLAHQANDIGDFMTNPAASLQPGGSTQFAYVETENAKPAQHECKGSLTWNVGSPTVAVWRVEWDNPIGKKNTVTATLDPQSAGFQSLEQIGQGDENVPIAFTISGGGDAPVPPPPTPDDDFAPPPKSKQPTLRKGDKSPDGWVEYAQRLMNKNKLGVTVNGDFDGDMETKVKQFQGDNKCLVDGIIGNETWSMLREGPREAVGTDKRKPHSFEQKNAQARFVTERPDATGYNASEDRFFMLIVSVGEQPIDKFHATLKVTQPDQTSHTHKIEIGPVKFPSPDGQGNFHEVEVKQFKRVFGLKPDVDPLKCTVDAFLDSDIGGDRWTGPVTPPSF